MRYRSERSVEEKIRERGRRRRKKEEGGMRNRRTKISSRVVLLMSGSLETIKRARPFLPPNVFREAFPNRTYYCFHHLLFILFLEVGTIRARGSGEGREDSMWGGEKYAGDREGRHI